MVWLVFRVILVELPSQIDEHWAFEPEVLNVYAKHYQTGEVIPAGLVVKNGQEWQIRTRLRYG